MQSPVHVLSVIDHLALGGAEVMLGRFAEAAPEAGIDLSVICLTERDGNLAAKLLRDVGIEPLTMGIKRLRLRELNALKGHMSTLRPDVVHTHLGSSDGLGGIAARSLRIPAVSTIHAMRWGGDSRARLKLELEAGARRRGAARIIAVSESSRRAYLARGWAPAERVVTIRNGLDLLPTPGAGAEVRRELGLADDDLVVGMVSALRPEKAHDVAIAAVARARETFPQLRLLIAGQGAHRHEIEKVAAPFGDTVVMAGSRSDVMPVFDAIDVCLQPSRADALPTALIEAMAASVAVVGTNVGGIPEIIDDGVTGVLVDAPPTAGAVAGALSRVLGDAALRHELGEAGRRRYEQEFRAGPWVQRIRSLYDEVLAEAGATTTARNGVARRLHGATDARRPTA